MLTNLHISEIANFIAPFESVFFSSEQYNFVSKQKLQTHRTNLNLPYKKGATAVMIQARHELCKDCKHQF